MKVISWILVYFIFFVQVTFAQKKATDIVKEINTQLAGAYNPISYYNVTGTIEQTQDDITQRIKLLNLNSVTVLKNAEGYNVNLLCPPEEKCITIIKKNNTTTQINIASFFFSDIAKANDFAKSINELFTIHNSPNGNPLLLNLALEKKAIIVEDKVPPPPPIAQPPTKIAQPKEENKTYVEEDESEQEDTKSKVKSKTEKVKQGLNDDSSNEGVTKKKTNNFCGQINQLVQIAHEKKISSLEGAETNAAKKINASKLKLKGAKENYISNYDNKRAFVAEFKTTSDIEKLMISFDELLDEIQQCLGNDWDSDDISSNKEYEDFNGDIKDIQFTHLDKKLTSTLHLILISDEDEKSTLFIRIQ